MEKNICIKCGEEFPATKEYFRLSKRTKTGIANTCKICKKAGDEIYREKNRESVALRSKIYQESNRGHCIEQSKKYYQENKVALLEKQKVYLMENKVATAKTTKAYQQKNKEAITEYQREYYNANSEKFITYNREAYRKKQYTEDHLNKSRIRCQRHRSLKNNLPSTLTPTQWRKCKEHFKDKCAYCGKEFTLAQEHFIPVAKGGEYTIDNIIPSCQSCNSSKRDSGFFEWYPRKKFYSKEREKTLLAYLGYKGHKQQLTFLS